MWLSWRFGRRLWRHQVLGAKHHESWKILVLRATWPGKSLDLGFGSCFDGVPRLEPWKKRTEEVQEAFQKDAEKTKRASQMHNALGMQHIATYCNITWSGSVNSGYSYAECDLSNIEGIINRECKKNWNSQPLSGVGCTFEANPVKCLISTQLRAAHELKKHQFSVKHQYYTHRLDKLGRVKQILSM